jgi:glycosyltransferase involved in cell wall biosynthesis
MAEREILDYVDGNRFALLSLTFSGHSGIAEVVRRQAEILSANGHSVTVFCFESDVDAEEYEVVELYSPEGEYLTRIYRVVWPLLVLPLLALIGRLRTFDTLISHKYPFNVACAGTALLGPTYVYYDHGVAPPEMYDGRIEKVYSKLMRKLQAVSARPATTVIAISQFIAAELVEEWGPQATAIVYNSPSEFLQEYDPDLRDIRSYHDIPDESPVVLFVGRITKHKNVHCLIEAHSKLTVRDGPDPHLIVVGKPTQNQYYERVTALADERVHFAGYVDEQYLTSYYTQSDVYATASLWEGCNLTVLEAQLVDLPVVAFDAGAHPETVESPPGRLVPKGDCDAFARQIGEVLEQSS